ncbi:MAG: hypothetical protein DMG29_13990 [Acidobacteria bacterium]|nr:MAG: hypothetical protein DMG29_13990 [Acidobacteriota bacterium]
MVKGLLALPDTSSLKLSWWTNAGGLETTRRIKAELPQTRVILLSAVDGNVYRDAAKNCGADAFLLKGVPVSEVLSVIRHGTRPSAV